MKTYKLLLVALLGCALFSSCEKNNEDPLQNEDTDLRIGDLIDDVGSNYYDVARYFDYYRPFEQETGNGYFLSVDIPELGMTAGIQGNNYDRVKSINLHTDENNPYGVNTRDLYERTYKYLNHRYGDADNGYGNNYYNNNYMNNYGYNSGVLGNVAIALIGDLARTINEKNGGQWISGDKLITLSYHSHSFSLIIEERY